MVVAHADLVSNLVDDFVALAVGEVVKHVHVE